MILPINIQLFYFLSTIIAGIVVGILFDMYRVALVYNNPNKILLAFTDLLYWLLCALVVFVFFLYTNNGNLRYYTFIGILVGLFFYFKLASKKFIIGLRTMGLTIAKFFRLVYLLIAYPARYIAYFLKFIIMRSKTLLRRIP